MFAPPEIGGGSLGDNKDTAYCCRDHEEEPNEEEEPLKHIRIMYGKFRRICCCDVCTP